MIGDRSRSNMDKTTRCLKCNKSGARLYIIYRKDINKYEFECYDCGYIWEIDKESANKFYNKFLEEEREMSRIEQIFDERKELFVKKNNNYGSSYMKTGEIIDLILEGNPPILRNKKDVIVLGVLHRLLDKIVRYVNLRFTEQEDKVQESIAETMGDAGVYSFILQDLEEEKKNDENE